MSAQILIKPIMTEKSMQNAAKKVYTFEVNKDSSKEQIKRAAEDTFKVKVAKVTTTTQQPSVKRTGKRRLKMRVAAKKIAKVWVGSDDTIELFELKEVKNA